MVKAVINRDMAEILSKKSKLSVCFKEIIEKISIFYPLPPFPQSGNAGFERTDFYHQLIRIHLQPILRELYVRTSVPTDLVLGDIET